MALDRLQSSTLTHAFTDLLTDLGDLVQKEMQLAKAEVTAGKYLDGRGGAGRIGRRFAGRGSGRVCDRKRRTGLALVVLAGGGRARGELNRDFLLRALLGGG
jgi:hypothetical protein